MEEAVSSGDSDIEMLLNEKGTVVAHSDQNEVGRDYSSEDSSLGALLFSRFADSRSNYVEVEYDGAHYIAYVADIRDGWRSVSVKDSTSVIRSLKTLFLITIGLVLSVILIISVIMTKSNQRIIVAGNLSSRLSSTADIYISMHEIDLMNDTFVQVRNTKEEAVEMIGKNRQDAAQVIHDIVEHFSDLSSRDGMFAFVDLSTLAERLKDKNTITSEFLSMEKLWRKARFIVSARNEDGRVIKVMFMIEDIDEEKRAREKADEAINILNTRISSIANIYMTAHELDVATDTFTELKSESKIVNDMVGATRVNAQATLRKVMEMVSHPASYEDVMRFINLSMLERRLKDKNTISVEYMNKSGLWRRGRFIVSGRNEKGKLTKVLWLSEDIDSEKKERDRLIDMSERAIAANEAKSAFLSNMSRELRTPINAILGMNEGILRECQDEKIRSYSENIESTGSRLLGMVDDILDFSGIEAGKLEIISAEYDLPALIEEVSEKIRPKAEEKELSFVLDIEKELPAVLHGDQARIRQVLFNMLASAVKNTEKGSVILGIHHRISEEEPDYVSLDVYVQDTGAGIKPEDIPELFSGFGHIGFGDSKEDVSAGLGMNITYKLLALMGATLQVDSVYGIGSKFYFSLKQKTKS